MESSEQTELTSSGAGVEWVERLSKKNKKREKTRGKRQQCGDSRGRVGGGGRGYRGISVHGKNKII